MGVITEIFNTISRVVVLPSFYYMIFQSAAPILLAALAVAVAIKANAINMGIEGIMTVTSLMLNYISLYISRYCLFSTTLRDTRTSK